MTVEARSTWQLDDSCLLIALADVGQLAADRMRGAVAEVGLTPRHCQVLVELARTGSQSQQALVELLGVDPSVLVTLLNDLESSDCARRRRDPADRRRHIVELAPRGVQVVAAVESAVEAAEREVLADLDGDETAMLRGLLARLRRPAGSTGCDQAASLNSR